MKPIEFQYSYNATERETDQMAKLFGELINEQDASESYEPDTSVLFRDKDGATFNFLRGSGCSCWEGDWYGWNMNLTDLLKWAGEQTARHSAWHTGSDVMLAQWIIDNKETLTNEE